MLSMMWYLVLVALMMASALPRGYCNSQFADTGTFEDDGGKQTGSYSRAHDQRSPWCDTASDNSQADDVSVRSIENVNGCGDTEMSDSIPDVWPDKRVPYRINDQFSAEEMATIEDAVSEFNSQTCIEWFRIQKDDHGYKYSVEFVPGPTCHSKVGRAGITVQPQQIILDNDCATTKFTVVHEMMHAIGFHHEQSRPDSRCFLKYDMALVPESMKKNFINARFPYGSLDYSTTEFDYSSVMFYGYDDGVEAKIDVEWGQRNGFSATDLLRISMLYNCSAKEKECVDMGCSDENSDCRDWSNMWKCYDFYMGLVPYMAKYCKKSCELCGVDTSECRDNSKSRCDEWIFAYNRQPLKWIKDMLIKYCRKTYDNCSSTASSLPNAF